MPSYVVYVDQVIAGSLVMNLMILWITARLGRVSPRGWRLLAGASIGAFYSLVLFIPTAQSFTGPEYKLPMSILMVVATFYPVRPKKMIVLLAYFYLGTFALGGTVMGIISFLSRNVPDEKMAWIMQAVDAYLWYAILLALAVFWVAGKIAPAALQKRLMLPLLRADMDIVLRGQSVHVAAMVDTGNSLTDPLTGHPVVVAEYATIKGLLPDQVRSAVEKVGWKDGGGLLMEMGDGIREGNFRIIPYHSVGCENGWLVGFRPDEVILRQGGRMNRTSDVVIALYPERLRNETPCGALIPPTLFESTKAG